MKDRLQGCRKAIMVNRITVTAFGWLQLFKTRLRMGNFLSGSILGTPTFGSSRAEGGLSAVTSFVHLKGFLCTSKERMCCPLF